MGDEWLWRGEQEQADGMVGSSLDLLLCEPGQVSQHEHLHWGWLAAPLF